MDPLPQTAAEPLRADAIVKRYGARTALDHVSFTLGPGELVALLGPNGAGKTTLLGCLLGFLLPDSGEVRLFGADVATLPASLRARTGFVPQTLSGFGWYRVGELMDYLAAFYAQPPPPPDPALLAWAALDPRARVKTLSGGQKQRLAIVLGLRHRPDLLILDEPVASLDPQARRDFMRLLQDYATQSNRTVLISSHILSDLERIATRAIFLAGGRIAHDTSMQRFRQSIRWISAPTGNTALRKALPPALHILKANQDRLLVDGWTGETEGQLSQSLGVAVTAEAPDLETAFLEITA